MVPRVPSLAMAPSRAVAESSPLEWVRRERVDDGADRPLLLLLHGSEDDPAAMLAWSDALDPEGRFRALVAAAPFGTAEARTWFTSTPRGPMGAEIRVALDRLGATVDRARAEPGVSADPAVVLGYSQGGAMALLLASERVTPVTAAVSVCGWLPDGEGWSNQAAAEARTRPPPRVLVLNTRDDDVVPIDFGEASALALRSDGLAADFLVVDGTHHPELEVVRMAGEWLYDVAGDSTGAGSSGKDWNTF